MNLQLLRENLPERERLWHLAAGTVTIVALLGDIILFFFFVIPQSRRLETLTEQVAVARQELEQVERTQVVTPADARAMIAAAQSALLEEATLFLSETEAAEMVNRLYGYAEVSDVEVVSIQSRPVAQPTRDFYAVQAFRLQVAGTVRDLLGFVARVAAGTPGSVLMRDMDVTRGGSASLLTLDLLLYTSPYASGVIPGEEPGQDDLEVLQIALRRAWEAQRWQQVIDLANQILLVDPGSAPARSSLYQAYVNYGYELLNGGNPTAAVTQFERALNTNPEGTEAQEGLVRARALLTPTPTSRAGLVAALNDAWEAEDWPEAIRLLEQMRELEPTNQEWLIKLYSAHVNYGYRLAAEGRREAAREQFAVDSREPDRVDPDGAADAGAEAGTVVVEIADERRPESSSPSLCSTTPRVKRRWPGWQVYRGLPPPPSHPTTGSTPSDPEIPSSPSPTASA